MKQIKLKPWHYDTNGLVKRPPDHVMKSNGPFAGYYTQARKDAYLKQQREKGEQ